MWGRQRADCLKPQHLVAVFPVIITLKPPEGCVRLFLVSLRFLLLM